MAKLYELGPPDNAGEKLALEYLKANLPNSCIVLGDVSVPVANGAAQVDAVVLGQLGVYSIEVKEWRGKLAGRTNGPWMKDGMQMPNPCEQAVVGSKKLRTYIRRNAQHVYGDARLFHALDVYALVVLTDPRADTKDVQVEESRYFRMCTRIEDVLPKFQQCQTESKKFIRIEEVQRIAELLGVPKGELDAWAEQHQPTTTRKCGKCGAENRGNAKFCLKCGSKF